MCTKCPNYKFRTTLDGVDTYATNTCKTCHGPYQCTECISGYYLRTNTDRSIVDAIIGVNPSVCE
jgi:hypothetical protein